MPNGVERKEGARNWKQKHFRSKKEVFSDSVSSAPILNLKAVDFKYHSIHRGSILNMPDPAADLLSAKKCSTIAETFNGVRT